MGFIGLSRSVILSVVLRAANQNLPLAGGKRTITNAKRVEGSVFPQKEDGFFDFAGKFVEFSCFAQNDILRGNRAINGNLTINTS